MKRKFIVELEMNSDDQTNSKDLSYFLNEHGGYPNTVIEITESYLVEQLRQGIKTPDEIRRIL